MPLEEQGSVQLARDHGGATSLEADVHVEDGQVLAHAYSG
jgi:hypothetical protein